uniref:hypothetical protein n=1 Tax=Parerythrobacter lutipelagi TaxID=1964208 RepID=UPI0010F7EF79|nr:hypothetical protein [Parerythrobacter lutipelagi]
MSNIAGKAYAINAMTSMSPRMTWFTRVALMSARTWPAVLAGLFGLGLIHFARWVIIRRDDWPQLGQPKQHLIKDHMIFVSNFNGTWGQYAGAFSAGLPLRLDLLWYGTDRYPGAVPVTPFAGYIRNNQIATNYYYNATPGNGQRDIKMALKLAAALRGSASRLTELSDEELAAAYDQILLDNQNGLGSAGYAPVASLASAEAARNRARAIRTNADGAV